MTGSLLKKVFLSAAAFAFLNALPQAAMADDGVNMAPPVAVASNGVFDWRDIPDSQPVYLNRAAFDPSGYQLYDTVGEQIVVPFEDNNLYVMKFAYTDLGRMYFVRQGGVPVLYVPRHGYLENASVPGSRWYPFPAHSHPPRTAVFLGIAPSWNDYIALGWRDGMIIYGGYGCDQPYYVGCPVVSFFAIDIMIGGSHYHGWNSYRNYDRYHPAPFYPGRGFVPHPPIMRHPLGGGPHAGYPAFRGAHPGAFGAGHSFGGAHPFHGSSPTGGPGHSFGGAVGGGSHPFHGGAPSSGPGHSFGGAVGGGSHPFHGGAPSSGPGHSFGGAVGGEAHPFHGGASSGVPGHSFGGAVGGEAHPFHGGSPSGGPGHSFGGATPGGGSHPFHGAPPSGGAGHSSGGAAAGGHQSHGGGPSDGPGHSGSSDHHDNPGPGH